MNARVANTTQGAIVHDLSLAIARSLTHNLLDHFFQRRGFVFPIANPLQLRKDFSC
jgi:hypothetical protein